jgi:hypothetical protein
MTAFRRETLLIGVTLAVLMPMATPADAQSSYEDAFTRRVNNSSSRGALDDFVIKSVNQGQYDQALSTLEEVLLGEPNDIDARVALARLYFQIGAYDLAGAHLDEALRIASPDLVADIEAIRRQIEQARSGYQTEFAVTAGGAYNSATLNVPSLSTSSTSSVYTPFVIVDGAVIFNLETASRDELRIGGNAQYERSLADTDFDGDFDDFHAYGVHGEVTYSKGLPDIIDTLRLDVSGYGLIREFGGGRQSRELGAEAELSVQPTVESRLTFFGGYGWLGGSTGLHGDHRVRYGATGEVRVAPGVSLGALATGYQEWGVAPVAFSAGGTGYQASGYEVGGSISHLLFVSADGKSWVHQFGGTYSRERILDYAAVAAGTADLADRSAWEVYWDHTVQIATQAELNLRVSYGREDISDTLPLFSANRDGEFWSIKTGLTFRFN